MTLSLKSTEDVHPSDVLKRVYRLADEDATSLSPPKFNIIIEGREMMGSQSIISSEEISVARLLEDPRL